MVKHSLENLLDKYPFFFDKRPVSNFYKITKVYNENFKLMYNDLFRIYESFHLNKKLLIWKEQEENYNYIINFVVNFPLIKTIKIYKNDDIIYENNFDEIDEVNNFQGQYHFEYNKLNVIKLKSYMCSECGQIYFNEDAPEVCTNGDCENDEFTEVNVYKCKECGELYFISPQEIIDGEFDNNCSVNNHLNSLELVNVYKCRNCGQIYFDKIPPLDCEYCFEDNENNINTKFIEPLTPPIYYDDDTLIVNEYFKVKLNNNDVDGYVDIPISLDTFSVEDNIVNDDDEDIGDDGVAFNVEIPEIPNDTFLIYVDTYEEYIFKKGFPENDEIMGDVYDHDISLDEIGKLNNIPRKKYDVVTEVDLYPYTEPPYNNKETEDDYHYMKRMIEYNMRLWVDSPPSLELWKIYGVDSDVINRERYLLKVFDENKHPFDEETGLVQCWNPELWEHKDKFCDGSANYGEYFYVTANNIRPIPGENVDFEFSVMNGLGEIIEEDFYVEVYRAIIDDNDNFMQWKQLSPFKLEDKKLRMSYKAISINKPSIFRFKAYYSNDLPLGQADIILNSRTEDSADYYVNVNPDNIEYENKEEYDNYYKDYVANGSRDAPFLRLEDALSKVNGSLNLICLMSDVELTEPLIINHNTIILGMNLTVDERRVVPKIIQKNKESTLKYDKNFFKIIGNKNCKLTLSNIRLKSGQVNSFVGINSWLNNSGDMGIYETVRITGGPLDITIVFNQDEYFPYDFVKGKIFVKNSDGNYVSNEKIYWIYNDVKTVVEQNTGEIDFKININENVPDVYLVEFGNISDTYFESQLIERISAIKEPEYIIVDNGEQVTLSISDVTPLRNVKLYIDGQGLFKTLTADENGKVTFDWVPEIGRYVVYYTYDDERESNVEYEWIVESSFYLTDLPNTVGDKKVFIKNVEYDKLTGDISYDEYILSDNPTLKELDGVVLDLKIVDGDLEVDEFISLKERQDSTKIYYSEAILLQNALCSIYFDDDTGILTGDKLGKFW